MAGVVVPDEAAPMETDSNQEAAAQRDMVCMRCKFCIASCNTLLHYTNIHNIVESPITCNKCISCRVATLAMLKWLQMRS